MFSHRILVLHFPHFLLLYFILLFIINFSFLVLQLLVAFLCSLIFLRYLKFHSSSLCLFLPQSYYT